MRENLHRFFRAARGAGVHVSPAESIDAMRAVEKVGFAERGILRDTLLLTLAKSEDEKKALGACFDLFFSQPEPSERRQANDNSPETDSPASQSDPGTCPSIFQSSFSAETRTSMSTFSVEYTSCRPLPASERKPYAGAAVKLSKVNAARIRLSAAGLRPATRCRKMPLA